MSLEKQRRVQENSKLNLGIKKFEDEKAAALKNYKDEEAKVNSNYADKLAEYNKEFDRVTRERARLTAEYNKKVQDNLNATNQNKAAQDKYKADYALYEKKLTEYSAQVSKIESDYAKAYDDYLKAMSEYNKKVLANSIKYETEYNKVADKNATAHAKYLEDKARIEKENAEARANYEKEVANIKAENAKAQKEYQEALAKWKAEKVTTENTVKTKDLIDAVLTGKIDELKKQGVNVTVGREEVTEVDGTNGKVSESDANRKLKELTAGKIDELERASKTQAANDATNKDYSSKVFSVKAELAKIMGITVNYTDGGKLTDVNAAKTELDQKLNQAKLAGKLAGKLSELNTAIKAHDTGVVDKLKAGGIDAAKAQEIYSKKTVVDVGPLTTEYNNLMKKADLSDADINAFVTKVNGELDKAKESISKAINKRNSPSSGTELDDTEYEKKLAEYKEKLRKFNANLNKNYVAADGIRRDLSDMLSFDKDHAKNKTDMKVTVLNGKVEWVQAKNGVLEKRDMLTERGIWSVVNSQTFGSTGKVEYTPFIMHRGAKVQVDYTFKDGSEFLDPNDTRYRMVFYKIVNGQKVAVPAKKMRYTLTNNGSALPSGELGVFASNDMALPFHLTFSSTISSDQNIDLSNNLNSQSFNTKLTYEFFDADGNKLYVGRKLYEPVNVDNFNVKDLKYQIVDPAMFDQDVYKWKHVSSGDNSSLTNHNVDYGKTYAELSYTKPDNWDNIEYSKDYRHDYETNNGGYLFTRDEYSIPNRKRLLATGGKAGGSDLEDGSNFDYGDTYTIRESTAAISVSNYVNDGFIPIKPFGYTRKSTPVSVLSEIVGNNTIDVPIKENSTKPVNVNVNPVKVVYKYKETFTKKEPTRKPDKPVPDEATVVYKELPKEPIPDKIPGKTLIPDTPPKEPVKPNKPVLPEPPKEPVTSNGIIENPTLELPELPKKPWEPDKPIEPKLPKIAKFSVIFNEYKLKESKLSHAGSFTVKHKLASYANSFTLRKL